MSVEERVISQYYKFRTDYGGYTVYFENDKRWSKKEIRKIFSKYGPIRKVAQSHVYLGSHCFVTFVNEQDVRRCIQEMNSHGEIQLLGITRGKERPSHLLAKNHHYDERKAEPTQSQTGAPRKVLAPTQPKPDVNSMNKERIDDNIIKYEETLEKIVLGAIDDIDYAELSKYIAEPVRPPAESRDIINEIRERLDKFSNVLQKITILNSQRIPEKSFYVLLDSCIPWKILKSVVVKEEVACPVILANANGIPSADVLMDLLVKYQPLLITHMEVTTRHFARYCRLYFKDAESADKVEAEFDGKELWGSKLIVQRVTKLK
uniref:RRM domain-containing protein n=1 Tax=Bracon brevicornis TaxID=1563983 RepID=A0A6V7JJZ4_9HYME